MHHYNKTPTIFQNPRKPQFPYRKIVLFFDFDFNISAALFSFRTVIKYTCFVEDDCTRKEDYFFEEENFCSQTRVKKGNSLSQAGWEV